MGTFTPINIEKPCPKCGSPLEGQSKSLHLTYAGMDIFIGNRMEGVSLDKNMNGSVHVYCNSRCDFKPVSLAIEKGEIKYENLDSV